MIYVTFTHRDGRHVTRRYRGIIDIDAMLTAARRYRDAHGYAGYSIKFYR